MGHIDHMMGEDGALEEYSNLTLGHSDDQQDEFNSQAVGEVTDLMAMLKNHKVISILCVVAVRDERSGKENVITVASGEAETLALSVYKAMSQLEKAQDQEGD